MHVRACTCACASASHVCACVFKPLGQSCQLSCACHLFLACWTNEPAVSVHALSSGRISSPCTESPPHYGVVGVLTSQKDMGFDISNFDFLIISVMFVMVPVGCLGAVSVTCWHGLRLSCTFYHMSVVFVLPISTARIVFLHSLQKGPKQLIWCCPHCFEQTDYLNDFGSNG